MMQRFLLASLIADVVERYVKHVYFPEFGVV